MKPARAASLLLLVVAACRPAPQSGPAVGAAAGSSGPVAEGKTLLEQGQLDAALAQLQQAPNDPDGLYYQAVVHLKMAEVQPATEGGPKDEELQALALLEQALATKPDHALAQRALADLLAPYSIARFGPQATKGAKARKGAGRPTPPPAAAAGAVAPDIRPERVVAAYKAAIAGDKANLGAVEALVAYARAVGRLDDAEWAFRERIQRDQESPEPHIAFGDFLVQARKDPMRAIEQYNLALVWQPDSVDAKNRIADIYLGEAEDHFDKKEYASTEARLAEAQKFITDPQSYQAARIREIRGKLRSLRR
jgi:hypothetical protein